MFQDLWGVQVAYGVHVTDFRVDVLTNSPDWPTQGAALVRAIIVELDHSMPSSPHSGH